MKYINNDNDSIFFNKEVVFQQLNKKLKNIKMDIKKMIQADLLKRNQKENT